MQFVEVAVSTKTKLDRQVFTYQIKPEQLAYFQPGILVSVPFRSRQLQAVVLQIKARLPKEIDISKLKPISKILDPLPVLDQARLELAQWMSEYYLAPIGEVIFTIIPPQARRIVSQNKPKSTLIKSDNLSGGQIYTLYDRLANRIESYIRLVQRAIKVGKQTIILFPEINLGSEILQQFQTKFKSSEIALLHGNLTKTQRYQTWSDIRSGKKKIIIGARSAIFAPVNNLGLIIIDEPEDFAYKEEQSPHYHTLTITEKIRQLTNANLVIGSLYPNLQSYDQILKKQYKVILKPQLKKHINKIGHQIIDLKKEKGIISYQLEKEIKENLVKKKKILLFVNRRGAGSSFICQDCGKIIECPECNLPLTYHQNQKEELICHRCNFRTIPPTTCSYCKSVRIKPLGIGTQSVEKEIKKFFPNAKTIIVEKSPIALRPYILTTSDIIIATQKILDLPNFSADLTAVVQADNSLNLPDFKSSENIFLLLLKLTNLTQKDFIIQTYNPENYLLQNLTKPEKILNYIYNERKKYNYPPFRQLIKLLYQDKNEQKCQKETEKLANILKENGFNFLGPGPCFISKRRNKFRYQIVLQLPLQNLYWKKKLVQISNLEKWLIDVDPISLL